MGLFEGWRRRSEEKLETERRLHGDAVQNAHAALGASDKAKRGLDYTRARGTELLPALVQIDALKRKLEMVGRRRDSARERLAALQEINRLSLKSKKEPDLAGEAAARGEVERYEAEYKQLAAELSALQTETNARDQELKARFGV